MNRERILSILYDLTSTIGGEVSLPPLLTKTLQHLLHHTGYPCGLILLKSPEASHQRLKLHMAIGDSTAIDQLHHEFLLVDRLLGQQAEIFPADNIVQDLPCKQHTYQFIFKLPLADQGVILLLSPQEPHSDLPLEQMLKPVAAHLSKAIHLCQVNDQQKQKLTDLVEQRTKQTLEREEQMRLLLESTAEGIFGLDKEGKCTFVNPPALQLLGYKSEHEFVGHKIHDMIHHTKVDGSPYPAEECRSLLATELDQKICIDDEYYWRKDGSSIPVEYRSTPIWKDGHSIGQIVSFIDISERLKKEREEIDAREKLEHTQRLESLGVLAGGIAHDFNNILTAIMGNAALSQQKISPSSAAYPLIDRIIEASESAANLCQQMLAYSGKGKFTIKVVNLSDLVERMGKLLDVSIDKTTLLKYSLSNDLPLIKGDLAQLQQVIMNLLTNANESLNGENGMVHITTGSVHIDQAYLNTAYFEDGLEVGDYVFIEVSDTGCGMSKEVKERIFEPFFTTKVSGRGLGMSAMLGIIRGHNGALKIYSEEGKGSSIKVMFPAADAVDIEEEPAHNIVELPSTLEGKTILIVDDEVMLRDVVTLMLKSAGFQVILAENGQQCLEKYSENMDDIAMVLLDMMMPIMNGEEAFQKLRQINPKVKVLLCSGYNEQDATQRFTGKGLAGFIQKPYRPDALNRAVREILSSI